MTLDTVTLNPKQIRQFLTDAGVSIECTMLEDGTRDCGAKWRIELKHKNRLIYTCPQYTSAIVDRVWKTRNNRAPVGFYGKTPYDCFWKGYGRQTLHDEDVEQFALKHSKPKTPTVDDVLWCLHSDAQCVRWSTHADFCSELGYDTDSIKALDIYRTCCDTRAALESWFDLDALAQLFEDF